MGFCPESFRVCSLSSVENRRQDSAVCRVMRHQNDMITSDNLANDLHWGGEHIKLNELHRCTQFQSRPLISLFLVFPFTGAQIYE